MPDFVRQILWDGETVIPLNLLRVLQDADGKQVLQQYIGFPNGARPEWRDVPVYDAKTLRPLE